MSEQSSPPDVRQVVPFLQVSSMERSVRFYLDGLGFVMVNKWEVDGQVRWCWLTLGGASLMLQEFPVDGHGSRPAPEKPGQGVSLCFECGDAVTLYHEFRLRGLVASEPEVGNRMWVTSLRDPDGYCLSFESMTDGFIPEDTKLSKITATNF